MKRLSLPFAVTLQACAAQSQAHETWLSPEAFWAIKNISLDLLTDAKCGDSVLLADGVALSKVQRDDATEKNDVSGNSR